MNKQPMPINLAAQAAAGSLTDTEVSATAAIQETKLALTHTTADLYNNSVRLDRDSAVNLGINLILNWIVLVDQVTGVKYRVTLQNGEMVFTQVTL